MDIHNERREYLKAGEKVLHLDQMHQSPFVQFEQWLIDAKNAEILDHTAMMLATVDINGMPSQRTVLLKQFDENGFCFFTNLQSSKAKQINQNSQVSLIFPWLSLERQVIICGQAEKLCQETDRDYFLSRPRDSQIAAWISEQSSPIESRQMLINKFEQMAQQCKADEMSLPTFWGGYRVIPSRMEFWQGGAKRLHDRFEYTLQQNQEWSIQRLQP